MVYTLKKLDGRYKDLARLILDLWHPAGAPRGPSFYYALVDEQDFPIVILMFSPANPMVVHKIKPGFNPGKSAFLRRILTIPPYQGSELPSSAIKPEALFAALPHISLIYSYVMPRHSGALYKHAGWTPGYKTSRGLQCYYIMRQPGG